MVAAGDFMDVVAVVGGVAAACCESGGGGGWGWLAGARGRLADGSVAVLGARAVAVRGSLG